MSQTLLRAQARDSVTYITSQLVDEFHVLRGGKIQNFLILCCLIFVLSRQTYLLATQIIVSSIVDTSVDTFMHSSIDEAINLEWPALLSHT